MSEDNLAEAFRNDIDALAAHYDEHEEVLGSIAPLLKSTAKKFAERLEDLRRKAQMVRLGIIGQTNVGKSSLLNALFFDGKEILPKAATPMTAALTRIRYADAPVAKVTFYNQDDWAEIVELAAAARSQKGSQGNLVAGGVEGWEPGSTLVDAAQELLGRAPANASRLLGETREIAAETIDELLGELTDFVSADSRYAALVREIELFVPVEALRFIEIVDTPGLNDPIISRSWRTRDYLGKCDALLVLSQAGSFLDASDMDLIARTLPAEGVKVIRLLATKVDSTLVAESRANPNILAALGAVRRKINGSIEALLRAFDKKAGEDLTGRYASAAENMKNALPVVFTSTLAEMISRHGEELSAEEQHRFDLLNRLFPGGQCNPETFRRIGNLDEVHQILAEVITAKDKILYDRQSRLLPSTQERIVRILEGIRTYSSQNITELQSTSIAALQAQLKAYEATLNACKTNVSRVFDKLADKMSSVRKQVNAIAGDDVDGYTDIPPKVGTMIKKQRVQKTGFLAAIKRFFGRDPGFTERDVSVTAKYVLIDDVVDRLMQYAKSCQKLARKSIKEIFDRDEIAAQIRIAVAEGIKLDDPEFQVEPLLNAVDRAVRKIKLPDIELKGSKQGKKLARDFSGKVTGEDIRSLLKKFKKALGQVQDDLDEKLQHCEREFRAGVESIKDDFTNQVKAELTERAAIIEKQLKNRRASIAQYEKVVRQVNEDLIIIGAYPADRET
jgi:predicted GTPase/Sec-independent protein translocase protein TatA